MVGCAKITINFKISASNSVCYLHDSLKKRLQNQPSTYRNNAIFSKTLSTLSTWSTRTYLREVSPYGRLKECPLGRIVQSEVESVSRGSTVSFVGLFLTELKSLRAVCYWVYFEAIIFLRLSVSLCSLRSTLTEGINCRRHSCQNGNRSLTSMSLRGQDWVLEMTLAFCSLAKTLDAQRVSFQLQWAMLVFLSLRLHSNYATLYLGPGGIRESSLNANWNRRRGKLLLNALSQKFPKYFCHSLEVLRVTRKLF